jgi:hypothetical protein
VISLQDPGITVPGGPPKISGIIPSQGRQLKLEDLQGWGGGLSGPAGSAVAIANMILRPIDEGAKNVVTKRIHFCIVF